MVALLVAAVRYLKGQLRTWRLPVSYLLDILYTTKECSL